MTRMNPDNVVVDDNVTKLSITATADITATGWPEEQGKLLIYSAGPSAGETWVLYTCTCFAWARTNVEDPPSSSEGVRRIQSNDGDGFFLFQPQVAGKDALGLSKNSLAAWTTAAGATSDDQKTASGITVISDEPFDSDQTAASNGFPLFTVPPGQPLQVLWGLVPDAIANPLPARFAIGSATGPADPLQRVDYVGVRMSGLKMSKAYYDALAKKAETDGTTLAAALAKLFRGR